MLWSIIVMDRLKRSSFECPADIKWRLNGRSGLHLKFLSGQHMHIISALEKIHGVFSFEVYIHVAKYVIFNARKKAFECLGM